MSTGNKDFSGIFRILEASGVPLMGAVSYALAKDRYQEHVRHYDRWIAAGSAGTMSYLVRGRDRRADPTLVFPELKSVIVIGVPYSARAIGEPSGATGVRYARYLGSRDYHDTVAAKLESALRGSDIPELRYKVCVDTSAVLERAWAEICGLGWIGKNSMLIHPKWGSYLFIGVAFLNIDCELPPQKHPDYCGHCTRCLEGCPTSAFEGPRRLDSRRCISYLTLEHRSSTGSLPGPPPEPAPAVGNWVAGCDICQEVCPFNLKRTREESTSPQSQQFSPQYPHLPSTWNALESETEEQYRARLKDSALSRVKYPQFKRNLGWVKANRTK